MSPIRLRHVLLTHPQTPINKSLPKTFQGEAREGLKLKKGWKGTKDSEVQKLCKNQTLKPSRTSTSKSKNTRSRIIQIICLDPKVCWNQAQKPLEISINHKLVKLYGFKPPKPRRTSATNLQIRRTFEVESSKLPA